MPSGDVEGKDWVYQNDIETRHINLTGPLILALRGVPIVEFTVERITLTENYQGVCSFGDVHISLASDPITAKKSAHAGNVNMQKVAEAFLADVSGEKLRLIVDEVRLTNETFDGHGRVRTRFADLIGARLTVI